MWVCTDNRIYSAVCEYIGPSFLVIYKIVSVFGSPVRRDYDKISHLLCFCYIAAHSSFVKHIYRVWLHKSNRGFLGCRISL